MTLYLSGASVYCAFLLFCKFSDQECSKTDPRSWLVIIIASALWMIVIPISVLEICSKAKAQAKMEEISQMGQSKAIAQNQETPETTSEFDSQALGGLNPINS